ncbi:prepilin peptidase [Amycolatopsis keratiniphila]|uniref:Leader peptidase (Prepilin peptidase) / N-methyltransferase n=1 Tax=Amycolatopsis keratiniphila TaxID=129921 RepID=R4T933_9PSEU|nr:prepilin peptidase [Amycolatopsis keratiniphila]AGM07073.1 leader peptidase (prepilin peptidase) / N-methyltransferase [Amycolatopsis keratiniphila]
MTTDFAVLFGWEVSVVSAMVVAVGTGSLVAGPALLAAAKRTTGTALVTGLWAQVAVAATMSAATVAASWIGWLRLGATPSWPVWCWACALGIGLALTDLRCRRLPFPMVTALAGGCAILFFGIALMDRAWSRFGFACVAAVVIYGLVSLVQICAPNHTGGGDTALYGALALFLGWFGWDGLLRGLLFASGLTAVIALVVAVSSKSKHATFAAGPSLLGGALASVVVA